MNRAEEEKRIEELLAPLARVEPATMPHAGRSRASMRTVAPTVVIVLAALAAAALGATQIFGPLHGETQKPGATPLTCIGVVGKPASVASAYLARHGYSVSWRLENFGATIITPKRPNEPTAVIGGESRTVRHPPRNGIVANVLPAASGKPKDIIVIVVGKSDPNAPSVAGPEHCP
jgi:hypothetical protein